MSNCLCVGSNAVMLGGGKVNNSGVEARKDLLDLCKALIACTMLNQDLSLVSSS